MSDQSIPEWFSSLNALLARNLELDRLAHDREKIGAPDQHHRWLVYRLAREFKKYGCVGYQAWLTPGCAAAWLPPGAECPPTNPTPEEETAALNAVDEWLKQVRDCPPNTTAKEQQELRELRRALHQLVKDRLACIEDAPPTHYPAGLTGQELQTTNDLAGTVAEKLLLAMLRAGCTPGGVSLSQDTISNAAEKGRDRLSMASAWKTLRRHQLIATTKGGAGGTRLTPRGEEIARALAERIRGAAAG